MNINEVTLAGRVTKDPELRYATKGTAICKFGVAVNRTWKDAAGEKKEEALFADVDCFGKTAENIAQYFRKGSNIYIRGRLRLSEWEDKQSGQKRQKMGVILETFQFVDSKSDRQEPQQPAATPAAAQEDDGPQF